MRTTITATERLQLIGLLALAERHSRMLDQIRHAVVALVDERDPDGHLDTGGHVADAIYDDGRRDADQLLDRLHITVVTAGEDPKAL